MLKLQEQRERQPWCAAIAVEQKAETKQALFLQYMLQKSRKTFCHARRIIGKILKTVTCENQFGITITNIRYALL